VTHPYPLVSTHHLDRLVAQTNDAFLVPLTENLHGVRVEIDILSLDTRQFGDPDTGIQKDPDDCRSRRAA
jgi:hypothetical protein